MQQSPISRLQKGECHTFWALPHMSSVDCTLAYRLNMPSSLSLSAQQEQLAGDRWHWFRECLILLLSCVVIQGLRELHVVWVQA